MTTFPGADFALEEVRQLSVAALRVKFTQDPRALNEDNADDALNPDNYTLTGPDLNYVIGAATVDGDPQSIDVYLAAPIALGIWNLSVANIVEDESSTLIPPTTLPFLVTFTLTEDPLGHGAVNDETANILRKFLNPALKGRGWNSMIAGLASGDQRNWNNARLSFDQIFLSSASGLYLDRRASDEGIERPKGVNMSDALFRKLAIVEKTRKLTQLAVLEVLEVFYGRDTTHAFSESRTELFALQDEDDLVVLLDERETVTVTFFRKHFARIGMATAQEVAANISRSMNDQGSQGFAVAITDPTTNEGIVRIYSGTLGLTSSVRIIGGRANTQLLFSTSLFSQTGVSPFATWNVTLSPVTQGNLRFTMTAGTEFDLFLVHEGDLAYIYGDEFEQTGSNGTYEIEAVSVTYSGSTKIQWFEIQNPLGNAAGPFDQIQFTDLMFFRPTRKTIYDNPRHVIVCENGDHLDVVIPATTEIVDRGPGLAAYLNGQDSMAGPAFSLVRTAGGRVVIDVDHTHGLSVGDQIIVDNVIPTGETPPVQAGSASGDFPAPNSTISGNTGASIQSLSSLAGSYAGIYHKAVRVPDGRIMILGGETTPDGITFTPKNTLTMFQVDTDTVVGNGGRVIGYSWVQLDDSGTHGFLGYNFGPRYFGMTVLEDGRVFVCGGVDGDDSTGTPSAGTALIQFLPPDQATHQTGGALAMPNPTASHAQVSLNAANGGGALVSGGWTVPGTALTDTLRFDVTTLTWVPVTPMFQARMHHQLIGGATPLAVGGQTDDVATQILNTCEIYHPFSDLWSKTGNMTFARTQFGSVILPDGKVLVVGGFGYNPTRSTVGALLSSCEIFDPSTELWSNIQSMPSGGRVFPIVSYLATQNVVLVGGGGQGEIDVLDVTTMRWRKSRATPASNLVLSAGAIAGDDTFLIAGGTNSGVTDKVNYVVVPGSDIMWLGAGLNNHFRVDEVPDATHVVVNTTEYNYGETYNVARPGASITPKAALAAPTGVPGPFSYDVKNGFAITAVSSTTDDAFNHGGHYASMHLVPTIDDPMPALNFPDEEGFLVLQFGHKNVVGPIRYFGRLSDEDLILDAGSPFQALLPPRATVRLLSSRLPFEPASGALVGNFYVTGTAAGRVAAQNTINDIVAAGKQIMVSVIYPGDRGLGAEGFPQRANYKLSDKVSVWGGDNLDQEIPQARLGL